MKNSNGKIIFIPQTTRSGFLKISRVKGDIPLHEWLALKFQKELIKEKIPFLYKEEIYNQEYTIPWLTITIIYKKRKTK